MSKNLLVMRTRDEANGFKRALNLGEDWTACGYFAAMSGKRFDKIVFVRQPSSTKKDADALPTWVDCSLKTKLKHGGDGLIFVNGNIS